jgi:hypothetical protein
MLNENVVAAHSEISNINNSHTESPFVNALRTILFLLNFIPYLSVSEISAFHIFSVGIPFSFLKAWAIEELLVRLGSQEQRVQNPGRQKQVA